jgi:hypothetical protein
VLLLSLTPCTRRTMRDAGIHRHLLLRETYAATRQVVEAPLPDVEVLGIDETRRGRSGVSGKPGTVHPPVWEGSFYCQAELCPLPTLSTMPTFPSARAQCAPQYQWPSASTPWPMIWTRQCSQMGAMRWIAQANESNTWREPSWVSTVKARS